MPSACENFPPAADENDINHAMVTVVVTVDRTGQPLAVEVRSDPGFGFGAAARTCAMHQRYRSALDRNGMALRSKTAPIRVRFMR